VAGSTQNWVSLPGGQSLFTRCPVFEAMFCGTRGAAKTDGLLQDFAQHTDQGFGENWRGILFRQTYKQLSDIVAKTKRWLPPIFPGIRYNAGNHTWRWPTGEELLLRQARTPDDYWDYHGHEYPWIGWEELTNWPNNELYEAMKSCSRSAHPGMPRKYRSTANPFGVGHNWVKQHFIDPTGGRATGRIFRVNNGPERCAIHGSVFENYPLLAADPDYIQKLQAITSRAKRLAWLYGDWDISAGGMFDDVYDADLHVVDLSWKQVPWNWRVTRAFDWGSSRPFSVGWWACSDGTPLREPLKLLVRDDSVDGGILRVEERRTFPAGTLFRVGELYGWTGEANVGVQWTAKKIAKEILRLEAKAGISERVNAGPADASIYDTVNGMCIAKDMEEVGVHFVPSQKGAGSRINGWEIMRTRLASCEEGIEPGMYINRPCVQWQRTVPYLPRDAVKMDDVDTDSEDHIGDENRYQCLDIATEAYMESMH
jgi:hypothetical protein